MSAITASSPSFPSPSPPQQLAEQRGKATTTLLPAASTAKRFALG